MSTFLFCNHRDKEFEPEFQESRVSPLQTEVKQGKFVECIDRAKGCFKDMVCQYEQEKTKSQTAGQPMAPRGRATRQSRDTRKTN